MPVAVPWGRWGGGSSPGGVNVSTAARAGFFLSGTFIIFFCCSCLYFIIIIFFCLGRACQLVWWPGPLQFDYVGLSNDGQSKWVMELPRPCSTCRCCALQLCSSAGNSLNLCQIPMGLIQRIWRFQRCWWIMTRIITPMGLWLLSTLQPVD